MHRGDRPRRRRARSGASAGTGSRPARAAAAGTSPAATATSAACSPTRAAWRANGGTAFAPRADLAGREQRIAVAERLTARRGLEP
ncbi:transglycosylase family protein [Kitasatospora sp. DSM 101779]|uniref:transglycosylase family protein n=1 Tax=Kitasatospora sp. DSM 101779 TaxID=2853165 RepID=UPI003985822A